MMGIQLISVAFSLGALFFTYLYYRRKELSGSEMGLWALLWMTFLGVALFPKTISPYIQELGFSRLMDFIVMVAFVVMFIILLHNYLVVHRLQKRIEKLVRRIALSELDERAKHG